MRPRSGECGNLLEHLEECAKMTMQESQVTDAFIAEQPHSNPMEHEFRDVADAEELRSLVSVECEAADLPSKGKLPRTLLQALCMNHKKNEDGLFNSLFRYLLHLRTGPDGCDHRWVQNHKKCRQTSQRGLNWYQRLGFAMWRILLQDYKRHVRSC